MIVILGLMPSWVEGGAGIFLDLQDQIEFTYSWGIKEDRNNIDEALALWQGLV